MAAPVAQYALGRKHRLQGDVAPLTDTLAIVLCADAYVPDYSDTGDEAYDDLTDEVAGGGGYTTGGIALTGKAVTWDAVNSRWVLDADDITGLTLASDVRWAVLIKDSGTDSTSWVLQTWDLSEGAGGDVSVGSVVLAGGISFA
jgi:hypothetical protein